MDVAELSELYQKALKVKDAAVRGSVAQALAEAVVVKSSLAAASHATDQQSTLGDSLATRALAEVDQVQNSANELLAGRATGAAGVAAAQTVAAQAISAESIAAEALWSETLAAEPVVAEPFVAEPFVAEPIIVSNVKAGGRK
jgi:type IV secretory pathway VirJ component